MMKTVKLNLLEKIDLGEEIMKKDPEEIGQIVDIGQNITPPDTETEAESFLEEMKNLPSYRHENRDNHRRRGGDSSRNRRDYSRNKRSDSRNRTRRSDSRNRGGSSKRSSSYEVKVVHYSKYCKDTLTNNMEVISDTLNNCEGFEKDFIEIVYIEGNSDIDPYKLVVDSACPETVTGKPWIGCIYRIKR